MFNIYIEKVGKDWLQLSKQFILANDVIPNTFIFADDQVIILSTEDEIQKAVNILMLDVRRIPFMG
jgi:hypothetical protein